MAAPSRVVVVGGGLAGLSAACELLEQGANVTIIEKTGHLGGNASKAICGILGAGSFVQKAKNVEDDAADLIKEGGPAAKALIEQGAQDIEWLTKNLGVSDELVLRQTPGHSVARTISTQAHLPGAVITYAVIHLLEQVAKAKPERLEIFTGTTVKKILGSAGKVEGVEWSRGGESGTIKGPVVLCTGGFAGDTSAGSLLAEHAPQHVNKNTTSDERSNGDGIKLATAVGAKTENLKELTFHPTAAVIPGQENSQFKVILSDALCGAGAKLLNSKGQTFVDELKPASDVTKAIFEQTGAVRMVISESDASAVKWFIDFYTQRGVLKKLGSVAELAQLIGVAPTALGHVKDGPLYVATITPALYTCVGGVSTSWSGSSSARVLGKSGPIENFFAAGEVTAAPYSTLWDKSGVPLLHAVYSGRLAGKAAAAVISEKVAASDLHSLVISSLTAVQKGPDTVAVPAPAEEKKEPEKKLEEMTKEELLTRLKDLKDGKIAVAAAPAAEAPKESGISMEEVAKHNKKEDAWIVLFGEAIDVTRWISIHPGGEQAICAYLGQDATEEWQMIHKPGTVEKNLAHVTKMGKVIGGGASKAPAPVAAGDDIQPIEGDGGIPGYIGAIIYLVWSIICRLCRTIFFSGNFKFSLDNNRNGTIRSAIFLITFIIVHALGNFVDMIGGPDELNGEGYLFDRIRWTGGGSWAPASIVEEYLALALLLHVTVALKRSWDISMNYCVYTGRWNMLISGLTVLTFLQKHLQDFRFHSTETTLVYPPPYFIAYDKILSEGRIFNSGPDSGVAPVKARDLYTLEVTLFKDLGNVLLYTTCLAVFILHLCLGWKKLIPAEAMEIPKDHQTKVIYIGWAAAAAIAGMYASVPWYMYFAEPLPVIRPTN